MSAYLIKKTAGLTTGDAHGSAEAVQKKHVVEKHR